MRPVSQSIVGAVNGSPIVLDYKNTPFQVSVGVTKVGGTAVDYTLQYTYDDPAASTLGDSSTWYDSTVMDNETATSDVVLNAGPVSAIRIINAGAGTLAVRVYQAGP